MGCLKPDKCPFYKDSKTNHTTELASEATRDEGISFSRQLLKLFIIRIPQHSKRAQLTITISR